MHKQRKKQIVHQSIRRIKRGLEKFIVFNATENQQMQKKK